MNVPSMMKAGGHFITEGPIEHFVSGKAVTLCKGHTITRDDVDPPCAYLALSDVSFVLTDDPLQFDKIPALGLLKSETPMTGQTWPRPGQTWPRPGQTWPRPGQTWRRKRLHGSDGQYNFACQARDDEYNKWFVWHNSTSGEAFVISKDEFFADRHNWEQV